MKQDQLSKLEKLFVALSDKTRLRLLRLMVEGEVSVGFLVDQLNESQPKVSRHLAYMRGNGVVSTRRDGKWIYYAIAKQADASVANILAATLESLCDEKGSNLRQEEKHSEQRLPPFEDITSGNDAVYEAVEKTNYNHYFREQEMDVFLL